MKDQPQTERPHHDSRKGEKLGILHKTSENLGGEKGGETWEHV